MSSRKTLKSVSVDGLKPTIMLTPVIEPCGEGYRIHHIKSDSIAHDGRDTFVPLRHVSKQKRRIFELEDENAELREFAQAVAEAAYEGQMFCDECRFSHGCYNGGKKEHEGRGCQWLLLARELGIGITDA